MLRKGFVAIFFKLFNNGIPSSLSKLQKKKGKLYLIALRNPYSVHITFAFEKAFTLIGHFVNLRRFVNMGRQTTQFCLGEGMEIYVTFQYFRPYFGS